MDLVAEFGVSVLPENCKTPFILHCLHTQRSKIHAVQELNHRKQTSPLSPESVYDLIYQVTGNEEAASKAQAYFMLAQSKGK